METSVFIVGAGFSLAANHQYTFADREFAKRYPLAPDLGKECFGPSWKTGADVEAAFDKAIRENTLDPIAKLIKLIQTADYYLGSREATTPQSMYRRLLKRFPTAQFLSFNYDSLLEQVLLQLELWNPEDGFGVAVEVGGWPEPPKHKPSRNPVLHLHGSVLLYAEEFSWDRRLNDGTVLMEPMKEPQFKFDPDRLGHCFGTFGKAPLGLGYCKPEERIIVPIRNKKDALRESYVKVVYNRAHSLLQTALQVIAVGYRFAEYDSNSFDSLLRIVARTRKPLWLIAPDANEITRRLSKLYPPLVTKPVATTFEEWAEWGFTGPQ